MTGGGAEIPPLRRLLEDAHVGLLVPTRLPTTQRLFVLEARVELIGEVGQLARSRHEVSRGLELRPANLRCAGYHPVKVARVWPEEPRGDVLVLVEHPLEVR